MCKFKKKLSKMENVYGLSISIKEEEDIPYPSPLPPPNTTIIPPNTTTTMNLSKPSHTIEKNNANFLNLKQELRRKPKSKKKKR
jgi:hypothetical protein